MTPEEKFKRLQKDYNDFVYIVSHDFKAVFRKLSSLTSWISEDLEDGELDEVRSHVDMIKSAAVHMDGMLDGVTWLSRVDRIEEKAATHKIEDLISDAIEEFPKIGNLTIEKENIPAIHAPKEKIFKIIREILKNAESYNKSDQKIVEIRFEKGEQTSTLSFSDNGFGITNKDLDAPFKLFYNEKFKTGIESSGYGLTYARKLAESENGNVTISKSEEDKGTTLCLTLPSECFKV